MQFYYFLLCIGPIYRNSRRLKEVAKKTEAEVKWFRERARTLTVEECEGDAELHESIASILRLVASVVSYRLKHVHIVPWTFANADTQLGAAMFIAGVLEKPSAEHEALTVWLFETHKDDLQLVCDGGEVSKSLREEVDTFNDTPLDESAGEGYHRSTHHARVRAYNARSPYLKQSTRTKQNIVLIRQFLKKGPQGKKVVRYEWRFWSRGLQTKPRHFWWRVHKSPYRVFQRIYRMDSFSQMDWSQICRPVRSPGQGPPPKQPAEPGSTLGTDALRIDYLSCILKPLQWYCFDLHKAAMDESGQPTEVLERQYFQVLEIVTSQSRPSLMPTIKSHEQTMMTARLALNIQSAAVKHGAVDPSGGVILFEDSDAEWSSWAELGPWRDVRGSLQRFRRVEGSLVHESCFVAFDPEPALSPHAVTDLACPAILMIGELHRRGWKPDKARVMHMTAAIGPMDSREATRMKAYYVVLLEINRCMPVATQAPSTQGIPSDQPISYYKLLLKGVPADHGLGAKEYQRIMNNLPPLPEAPPICGESSDEDFLVGGLGGALPLPPSEDASHDDDPRGKHRPEPVANASSSSAKASAKTMATPTTPAPPILPPPALEPPIPEPPSPPSPAFILGGVAVAKGKAKAKAKRKAKEEKLLVQAIGGGEVWYEEYTAPFSTRTYGNWTFWCRLPGCPKDCRRTQGVIPRNMKLLSTDLEPLAFLHAWRRTPIDATLGHRKSPVADQAVKDFHENHLDELLAVRDMFYTP